ncbi:MAG: BatD family protein [Terrimicrobiaceae bacterium]|nr:BatD family protein [Terrimicrobiaceae bacterium]
MKLSRLAFIFAAAVALRVVSAASITAELSADETSVGVPVQMQVRVEGTTNVSLPGDLGVDGLQTQLTGRSTQVSIINGRMTTSGIYSYTIFPLREGKFEIPALEVNVDGHKQRTGPQKLLVQAGSGGAPGAAPGLSAPQRQRTTAQPAADEQLAYAEMIVPRQSIYVGEVVPVEVRFYFNERVGFKLLQNEPQVSGEGFTVQKFSPAKQTEEAVGASNYHVLSFKTAITAVKGGEMPIPKVQMQAVARVPSKGPQGMEDIFSQFMGGQMPGFTDDQEIKVESRPGKIRVKPLPAEGRPANFSGAVGEFTIAASADPTRAAPGDPVTLKVAVTGRGNFDAMGDPKVVGSEGWRVYPPTDRFDKSDAIGFSGTKTFEVPIVAQQSLTRTPAVEFSYFDPAKEKYFTLTSEPVAVEAAAAQAAPQTAFAQPQSTPGASQPSATPAVDHDAWLTRTTPRSWQPLVERPAFWIGNAAGALVFLGLAAGIAVRRARSGPAGRRAALARERDRLIGELGRADLSDEAFFAKAHEALALQARLVGESGPFEFVRSLGARGRDTAVLQSVLSRADEWKFSGGGVVAQVDSGQRQRTANALREACK